MAYSKKKNGKVKFVLTANNKNQITEKGREALELIHYDNKNLFEGYINLKGQYKDLEGIEVSRKDLGKIQEWSTKGETLDSKIWRILARHPDEVPKEFAEDEKLLEEYVNWIQSETNDTTNMKIYLDSQSNKEKLHAWCVSRPEDGFAWCSAKNYQDYSSGRFAGISGGSQSFRKKIL